MEVRRRAEKEISLRCLFFASSSFSNSISSSDFLSFTSILLYKFFQCQPRRKAITSFLATGMFIIYKVFTLEDIGRKRSGREERERKETQKSEWQPANSHSPSANRKNKAMK